MLICSCTAATINGCGGRVEIDDGLISIESATGGAGGMTAPSAGGTAGIGAPTSGGSTSASSTEETPAQVQQEMLSRWNRAVDASPSAFDFHWTEIDQFPHPTFQGGSEEAYTAFAKVLLAVLSQTDNFDYFAGHHLFDLPVRYGQSVMYSSMADMIGEFASSSDEPYLDLPQDIRDGLEQISIRIAQLG
jgi:hypothetical protein